MNLVDSYNRKINYMRISVTDRCNLRCVYCIPAEGVKRMAPKELLTYDEILRIVDVAAKRGVTSIRLTGGEPLVRKGLVGFVARLKAVPGMEDISLTTNGVLLKQYAGPLYDAGLRRMNVSLDSMDPGKYAEITGGNELAAVWEGIEEAEKAGFLPIKLNVVPLRDFNDDEIENFARLTFIKDFHVRFIEFMPIGAREVWKQKSFISTVELKDRIGKIGELTPVMPNRRTGPAVNYRLPHARGIIGFISPISDHFCGSCNRMRLTSDGRIRPCLFSDRDIDFKTAMREGCDDAEIERLFDLALGIKPDGHHLDAGNIAEKYDRTMSSIGG